MESDWKLSVLTRAFWASGKVRHWSLKTELSVRLNRAYLMLQGQRSSPRASGPTTREDPAPSSARSGWTTAARSSRRRRTTWAAGSSSSRSRRRTRGRRRRSRGGTGESARREVCSCAHTKQSLRKCFGDWRSLCKAGVGASVHPSSSAGARIQEFRMRCSVFSCTPR